MTGPTAPRQTWWWIQYLRGLAATGVVILGDASYSIYLFHFPALVLIDRLAAGRLSGVAPLVAHVLTILAIMAAVAVGVLLHFALEKPLLRRLNGWNRRLLSRSAPLPA